MPRIVIIGNSAAGFSAAQKFIQGSPALELTVITQEDALAYHKGRLFDFLGGAIKENQLYLCAKDFYVKNKINFLKDAKVNRLDTRKQSVVLKDATRIPYDYLVIASGQKPVLPDIPGTSKDGVFSFYALRDIKTIRDRLLISDVIGIVGDPGNADRLSRALAALNKEVKVISKHPPENSLPQEKIEWIDSSELSAIIGEGTELKAFKLSNGKAVGVSLLLFVGNLLPASEFLKESGVNTAEGLIVVDSAMRTNNDRIFACGSVCTKDPLLPSRKSWDDCAGEGAAAASGIIAILEGGTVPCQTS